MLCLKKAKNRTTIRSSNSTPGYLSKENENTNSKRYMHPNIHSSITYSSQDTEQPKCPPTNEWVKMWYIYTMEYYSAIKKNKILPLATTWMDLEGIMLSEISQTEKDKECILSLICGI